MPGWVRRTSIWPRSACCRGSGWRIPSSSCGRPLSIGSRCRGSRGWGGARGWILLCQILIIVGLLGLAMTDPTAHLGQFAGFAAFAAVAAATQDIAVDAWRIDVADEETPVELLSAIYQFGYRTASIVGGAFALWLSARWAWPGVFMLMAVFIALMIVVALTAPDTPRPASERSEQALAAPGELEPRAPRRRSDRGGRQLGAVDRGHHLVHGRDAGPCRTGRGRGRRRRISPNIGGRGSSWRRCWCRWPSPRRSTG